ncbi:MAG TPA: hypothetical protein VMU87_01390 [Stellaceae bacterium]|nr:hypothetical protein [Stellaceae bacterium]
MLARADAMKAADAAAAAPPQPAAPAITVEQFPGLCMGASMLTSLALHKIGYDALTPHEGEALTAALLKNAEAWDLDQYLGNARVAAGLDLVGCFVAILMPRIIADARKGQASPAMRAAAERAEAPANDEGLARAA